MKQFSLGASKLTNAFQAIRYICTQLNGPKYFIDEDYQIFKPDIEVFADNVLQPASVLSGDLDFSFFKFGPLIHFTYRLTAALPAYTTFSVAVPTELLPTGKTWSSYKSTTGRHAGSSHTAGAAPIYWDLRYENPSTRFYMDDVAKGAGTVLVSGSGTYWKELP